MNIEKFQELSKRTMPNQVPTSLSGGNVEQLLATSSLTNYALGLSGEAGEVVDLIKKHVFHGHSLDKDKIVKELGDVMHYVAGIATLLEIELPEVLEGNIDKLKKRFPEGFSVAASIARVDTKK
ncbi:nucleoside triphosphate pyrophosphohydrolase family protein [Bacillus pumilus]|uniref:nucleoside triphosphate pyrophosphohydrolase family protein n=1 Tax=Bacillus TaxID=1386 RepID=UPI001C25078E|nr:nucleoside triphosphate pyrophosphohydrolase family protein [Bacillus pumilus]MBU8576393.1 nucleoside triphosphate pyrophosphohydrolase family protein [Bacillus pumilus]